MWENTVVLSIWFKRGNAFFSFFFVLGDDIALPMAGLAKTPPHIVDCFLWKWPHQKANTSIRSCHQRTKKYAQGAKVRLISGY